MNCAVSGSFSLFPRFLQRPQIGRIPHRRPSLLSCFRPSGTFNPRKAIARAVRILLGQYDFTSISDYWAASRKEKLEPFLNGFTLTVRFGPAAGILHYRFPLRTFTSSICHDADSGCLLDQLDRTLSFFFSTKQITFSHQNAAPSLIARTPWTNGRAIRLNLLFPFLLFIYHCLVFPSRQESHLHLLLWHIPRWQLASLNISRCLRSTSSRSLTIFFKMSPTRCSRRERWLL